MGSKEEALRRRWELYDKAILAGRGHKIATWWPELAPLTNNERRLVLKFLATEARDGETYMLPSEEEALERQAKEAIAAGKVDPVAGVPERAEEGGDGSQAED